LVAAFAGAVALWQNAWMGIIFQVIILGIVQGLTEFLPISSSAHLILVPWLLGWQQLGLIFDVSLHVGTLLAILAYFRNDWLQIMYDALDFGRGRIPWSGSLTVFLVVGTVPAAIFGLLGKNLVEDHLRTPTVIVACMIGFGVLLWIADRIGARSRRMQDRRLPDAVVIGSFQMLALIPGVSRSGSTITAGLFRRFQSADAARISFLLSAPLMIGAGLMEGKEAYREFLKGAGSTDPLMRQGHPLQLVAIGVVVSAITGFLCIRYFLRYLQSGSLVPFAVYRIILGAGLLAAVMLGMPTEVRTQAPEKGTELAGRHGTASNAECGMRNIDMKFSKLEGRFTSLFRIPHSAFEGGRRLFEYNRIMSSVLLVLFLVGGMATSTARSLAQSHKEREDEKEKPKISMVARASPELRDHFKEMYTQAFTENLNDASLSKILDDQIDGFVKHLVQKNEKMAGFASELSESRDAAARRQYIRKIKETADDLDGTLRIWTDSLRPEKKGKDDLPIQNPTPQLLVDQVVLYEKQVNQFLFPENVAVSVKELQSEGFHWTLKKIQRLAQSLER
jgi:undecaprenyl-diphosphatase